MFHRFESPGFGWCVKVFVLVWGGLWKVQGLRIQESRVRGRGSGVKGSLDFVNPI